MRTTGLARSGRDSRSTTPASVATAARLSPDGTLVAATVGDPGPSGDGTVVLIDTRTGELTRITPRLSPRPAYLAWSVDGSQLFFAADGYGRSVTDVGRYVPDDDHLDLITLPMGGTLSFLPLDADEAGAFLEGAERVRH